MNWRAAWCKFPFLGLHWNTIMYQIKKIFSRSKGAVFGLTVCIYLYYLLGMIWWCVLAGNVSLHVRTHNLWLLWYFTTSSCEASYPFCIELIGSSIFFFFFFFFIAASKARRPFQLAGKIKVKAKKKSYSKLEIPYQAEVLEGWVVPWADSCFK